MPSTKFIQKVIPETEGIKSFFLNFSGIYFLDKLHKQIAVQFGRQNSNNSS